jgi:hypothetical protein
MAQHQSSKIFPGLHETTGMEGILDSLLLNDIATADLPILSIRSTVAAGKITK